MNPTRRRFLVGLSALAVAPALAACGADSSPGAATDTGGSGAAGAGGAEEGAFPVTIAHKYGETELTAAPTRIVCVGLTEQDALLAVGLVPVGVTKWFGDAKGAIFPWATEALGDGALPQVLDSANGVEIEKIAALAPDLIIGQYAGVTEKEYALLSKLAPTVVQSGEYADYGMPWEEMATNIGAAVGRPAAMRTVVDGVKALVAEQAAAHPEFAGKTAACITPYEGLFVYGPEDPRSRMLTDLGFTFPEILQGDDGEFGVSLSAERTADLEQVDVAVWLDLNADKAVASVFGKTDTSKEGRFVDISDADGDYYVAHSWATPLSIPYVLERYVPQLAAAVDGDPDTEVPAA
ncbi:ABC transporter substrate-binding protein [Nocardioides sp. KIGAM211]|uniref:ABC transporter substrate-binding protein n=1 Tax=Nocardioides luti TaxID=2761101 RepID=A0A7X0RE40_9ACTN|nr:ABC transporter substrate-binding protein [Nocardioides luti]MBB6626632.1 ABC transporter substrate-binding protein [Nocardioides luti]